MGIQTMLFCSVLGCLISLLIIPVGLLPGLLRSIQSRVGDRTGTGTAPSSSSPKSAPRLGGIVLLGAFLGVVTLTSVVRPQAITGPFQANLHIVWAAMAMAAIGIWNDYRRLGNARLLTLQALVAAALFVQGVQIESFESPKDGPFPIQAICSGLITVLWLVSLTNLVRIMDKVTALAATIGYVVLALVAFAGYWAEMEFPALCGVGMSGALAGFLVYNLPPSRVRLGGGGSCLIGFLIGSLTIMAASGGTILASSVTPFLVVLLLILGATFAVLRRNLTGLPLLPSDREDRRGQQTVPQRGVKPHTS